MDETLLELAGTALARLGYEQGVGAIVPLDQGISGAWSLRVSLPAGEAVLKMVTAAADAGLRQRARREIAFYRELAPCLPVPTPRLLGLQADDDGDLLLLLQAYDAPRALNELNDDQMAAVVAQVAGLHAAFWGQDDLLERYPWLRRGAAQGEPPDWAHAMWLWQTQAASAPLQRVITPAILAALPGWFDVLQRVERTVASYPCTLVHGDCHLGNVLWSANNPVWGDWQEVRVGVGPADMSFLLQRGCGSQDDAAFECWAEHYAALLAATARPRPDPVDTRRVMDVSELHMRLLEWPHYFDWLPPEAVAHQLTRIARLAERFERTG